MILAHSEPTINPAPAELTAGPTSRFGKFNAFVEYGQAELTRLGCAASSRLWFTIWRFERTDTDTARVGLGTLAECYGSDKSHILRMLKQLQQCGYLIILEAGKTGRGGSAVYRLLCPTTSSQAGDESTKRKGVWETPFQPEKGVSQTPFHDSEKVSTEHPFDEAKGVSQTPFKPQKGVWESTVQKKNRNTSPAAKPAGGGASKKPKAPPKETNPNHRPAVEHFCAAWEKRYQRKYAFAAKDAAAVKAILVAVSNNLGAFIAAVNRFIASNDPFVVSQTHSLCEMRRNVNRWLAPTTGPPGDVSKPPPVFDAELPDIQRAA